MTESDGLLFCCLAFICGIFCGSILNVWNFLFSPNVLWWFIILAFICGIIFLWRNYLRLSILFFFLAFVFLGLLFFTNRIGQITQNQITQTAMQGEFCIIRGVICEEPITREFGQQVKLCATQITKKNGVTTKVQGGIQFYTAKKLAYGDKVEVRGVLEETPIFETFNYRKYLQKDSIYAQMKHPQIKIIARNRGDIIYSLIISLRQKMRGFIQKVFSGEAVGIMRAYILGDKNSLSQGFQENLSAAGLSHIIAISGAHIVMFESMIFALFLALGFWRKQALQATLFFVLFYVFLSGFLVSAVRAAIMASFFIFAKLLGRLSQAIRILVISAAIMLAFNPLLLFYDISFQLSFLSVLGMCLLQPYFLKKLSFFPEMGFLQFRTNLATTFSALIFTLPVISLGFGKISLIAPLANLFALPIAGMMLALGACAVFLGAFWPAGGWVLALPVFPLVSYLRLVADFFGRLPLASINFRLGVIWGALYVFVLTVFVLHVRKTMAFDP